MHFTQIRFYKQTTLRTAAFTQSSLCAHALTQRFVHREAFTHRRLYTQRLSRKEAFTHRSALFGRTCTVAFIAVWAPVSLFASSSWLPTFRVPTPTIQWDSRMYCASGLHWRQTQWLASRVCPVRFADMSSPTGASLLSQFFGCKLPKSFQDHQNLTGSISWAFRHMQEVGQPLFPGVTWQFCIISSVVEVHTIPYISQKAAARTCVDTWSQPQKKSPWTSRHIKKCPRNLRWSSYTFLCSPTNVRVQYGDFLCYRLVMKDGRAAEKLAAEARLMIGGSLNSDPWHVGRVCHRWESGVGRYYCK